MSVPLVQKPPVFPMSNLKAAAMLRIASRGTITQSEATHAANFIRRVILDGVKRSNLQSWNDAQNYLNQLYAGNQEFVNEAKKAIAIGLANKKAKDFEFAQDTNLSAVERLKARCNYYNDDKDNCVLDPRCSYGEKSHQCRKRRYAGVPSIPLPPQKGYKSPCAQNFLETSCLADQKNQCSWTGTGCRSPRNVGAAALRTERRDAIARYNLGRYAVSPTAAPQFQMRPQTSGSSGSPRFMPGQQRFP